MSDGINTINLGGSSARLGAAIGTGLSSGLETLAKMKLKSIHEDKQAQALAPFIGNNLDLAKKIMTLPEKERMVILQNLPNQGGQNYGQGSNTGQGGSTGNIFAPRQDPIRVETLNLKREKAARDIANIEKEDNRYAAKLSAANFAEFVEPAYKDAKAAEELNTKLRKIVVLSKGVGLEDKILEEFSDIPFLKTFAIAWQSREAAEGKKEQKQFLKTMKEQLVGKVSNQEMEAYLGQFPDLMTMSEDQVVAVVDGFIKLNDSIIANSKIKRAIFDRNPNITKPQFYNEFEDYFNPKPNESSLQRPNETVNEEPNQTTPLPLNETLPQAPNETLSPNLIPQSPQPEQARTFGQQATGVAASLAKSPATLMDVGTGIGNLGKKYITDPISNLTGYDEEKDFIKNQRKEFDRNNPSDNRSTSEKIKSFVNEKAEKISPGSTSDKNIGKVERALRTTASSAPILALFTPFTAFGIASSFAADVAGNVVGESLKDMRASPITQFIGNVATSIMTRKGFGYLADKISGITNASTTINQFEEELYKKSKETGAVKSIKTGKPLDKDTILGKLETFVTKVKGTDIGKGFSETEKKGLLENAKITAKAFEDKLISPNQLADRLKSININYVDNPSEYSKLYKQYRGIVANAIEETKGAHPEFYSNFKAAQELHSIQKYQSSLGNMVTQISNPKKIFEFVKGNPALSIVLAPLLGKKAAAGILASNLIPPIINNTVKTTKIIKYVLKHKQGAKLLENLVVAGAKENTPLFVNSLKAVGTIVKNVK
jgi:hypothetical protein